MPDQQPNLEDGLREAVRKWEETLAAIYALETHKPGPPTREWRKEHIEEIRLLLSKELDPANELELLKTTRPPEKILASRQPAPLKGAGRLHGLRRLHCYDNP